MTPHRIRIMVDYFKQEPECIAKAKYEADAIVMAKALAVNELSGMVRGYYVEREDGKQAAYAEVK
jgi:hypothetical protein